MLRQRILAATLTLCLTGCAVGPNFKSPTAPTTTHLVNKDLPPQTASADVTGGEAQTFQVGQPVPGAWWTLFGSARLNGLVNDAVAHYPTLQAQQAAVREAREQARAEAGTFFPQITGTGSKSRTGMDRSATGLSTATVNVSYVFDVFGGERRQYEALEAAVNYQKFQFEGSALTLEANVVATAIQVASTRGQIEATHEIIAEEEKQLSFIDRKWQAGSETRADVLQQQSQLAAVRATLPPLQQLLDQAQHQLAVLTGRLPGDVDEIAFDFVDLTLPQSLPVSLPSAIVEQRPDIRAQEALLHQASAGIGVATAAMLPQFTLTGYYGGSSPKFNDLLKSGSSVWNLAGGITAPLFEGGTLLAQRNAARAAYDQSAAQYRQIVLNAFQQVADVLTALGNDAQALKANNEAVTAATASLDLTQKQYDAGAVDTATLLVAQQQFQQTRLSYVLALARRYADTTSLFQALGGGWWKGPDAAKEIPVVATEAAAKETLTNE